ncbi:MAG: tRNA pseudouridine55 synthase [Candidatus Krumholzibacteriia bacterium]
MSPDSNESIGGVLLVDKPAGVTSFDVVNAVRTALVRTHPHLVKRGKESTGHRPPRFKCGHAGTLDPLATGLLTVLIGKASRLSHYLLGLDKSYQATVSLGAVTDTLDADGEVTATASVPNSAETFLDVMPSFRGEIQQVPPIFSALKRDGQTLHKRARAGEEVAAPDARSVTIHELKLLAARLSGETPELELLVTCSSGTYIRSLARDLAEAAGTLGHIKQLRRLSVGPFVIEDAVENVMGLSGSEIMAQMQPMSAALPHLPTMVLKSDEAALINTGQQPQKAWLDRLDGPPVVTQKHGALFRIVAENRDLVAVGSLTDPSGEPCIAMVIPQ